MTSITATTLDKPAIKRMVLDVRRLLEEDITAVLRQYGLFADRNWLPVDKVRSELQPSRARMEAAIQPELGRIKAMQKDEAKAQQAAAGWYIREVAFTYLNRLVGLKCLEVRGLFPEVIQTRIEYSGRSLYHRDYLDAHPELVGREDDGLPAMLEAACREVTRQIRHLFDPDSNASIVWPRYRGLQQAIERINALPIEYWCEDEIIGWVYQFYNAEEKESIRKRGKPNLPIEVAVINQFFTPRWVVKFLVDNTLGRLWLEMHPGSPRVRAKCDYLVLESSSAAEDNPPMAKDERNKSDGQLFAPAPALPVNNPAEAPRRAAKLPQEIKLIDPASGTMHFGHYAFEVFTAIYQDARECDFVPDDAALSDANIPLAILRHNLHGVDIDLRPVQLAALSLYLKARVALRNAGVHDAQAATLPWQVNLVCADARLPANGLREQFLREYEDDPVLQRAWRALFNEMADIAQVGSLLRVEERFRTILKEHRPYSVKLAESRQTYLPGLEPPIQQLRLEDLPNTEDWSPHRSVQAMLEHLRQFARAALETADVNAQLFATEAEKTLSLLDVLMQEYDVVVMNPPYGESTGAADTLLKANYPEASNNLFAAFLLRGNQFVSAQQGFSGALVPSTIQSHAIFSPLRRKLLIESGNLGAFLDLGWDVLDDANVEVNAFTYGPKSASPAVFFKLNDLSLDQRHATFASLLSGNKHPQQRVFSHSADQLAALPDTVMSYWLSNTLLSLLKDHPSLSTITYIKPGLSSGDNPRYYKYWWEVNPLDIGRGKTWTPLANGGEYSPYYRDISQIVYWKDEGYEIKHLRQLRGLSGARVQNTQYFYLPGITYGKRAEFFNCQILPKDHIFTNEGFGIFPTTESRLLYLLGLLNSRLVQLLLNATAGVHKLSGYVEKLPYLDPNPDVIERMAIAAKSAHDLKAFWDIGNEICTRFDKPWLLMEVERWKSGSVFDLNLALDVLEHREAEADAELQTIQKEIDEAIYNLYQIGIADRALIERELSKRPPDMAWPQMGGKSQEEKRKEHVRRLLSYFLLQILKSDEDGLVPLVEGTGEPTAIAQLRGALETYFGEEVALRLEDDAARILGKSLSAWLDSEYIKWHTQLYKNRPVVWQLASERGTFACFLYYHKLDRDTLQKVRTVYVRPLLRRIEDEGRQAQGHNDLKTASAREATAEELRAFDEKLAALIDAGYEPTIDDGVKKNILPLQEVGILRPKTVV